MNLKGVCVVAVSFLVIAMDVDAKLIRFGQLGKTEAGLQPDQWISFSGENSSGQNGRGLHHATVGTTLVQPELSMTVQEVSPEGTKLRSNRVGSLLGINDDLIHSGESVSLAFNRDVKVLYVQPQHIGNLGIFGTEGLITAGTKSIPFKLKDSRKISVNHALKAGETLTLSAGGTDGGWSVKAIAVETSGDAVPVKTAAALTKTESVQASAVSAEEEMDPAMAAQWEQMIARPIPEWLLDAKFGIYAHWGLYSIGHNTSEWYGKNLYNPDFQKGKSPQGKLITDFEKTVGKLQDGYGYKDLLPFFTAENYNPGFWADLVKESGAQFAGFSIAHHDGFGLWDSDVYDWNVGKVGPKRDLYGEFVAELRKRDMKVITTSHMKRTYGWMQPPGKHQKQAREEGWDVMNPEFAEIYPSKHTGVTPEQYEKRWDACLREVVSKYQPDLLWFDGGGFKDPISTDFIEDYFKQADVRAQEVHVLNKRPVVGSGKKTYNFPAAFGLKDFEHGRDRPVDLEYGFFDSMTITGGCWGYAHRNGEQSMGADKFIMYLIDSVSRGGAILLSLGPKVDGTLPDATIQTLREIGAWLKVNGEAIHATRKWDYASDEEPDVEHEKYIYAATPTVNRWHFDKFQNDDIRYTCSKDGKYVYVMTLGKPSQATLIANRLGSGSVNVQRVELLSTGAPVTFQQAEYGLNIQLPETTRSDCAVAFKVYVDKP